MISNVILQHASQHLQEIKAMRGMPFGGLSVITVGDFYQLPSVNGPFVFQSAKGPAERVCFQGLHASTCIASATIRLCIKPVDCICHHLGKDASHASCHS